MCVFGCNAVINTFVNLNHDTYKHEKDNPHKNLKRDLTGNMTSMFHENFNASMRKRHQCVLDSPNILTSFSLRTRGTRMSVVQKMVKY